MTLNVSTWRRIANGWRDSGKEMNDISPIEKLEEALADTSGVYVNESVDEKSYFASVANDIRQHVCKPFAVTARVMAPGFPDAKEGSLISGVCVAYDAGYWLVYDLEKDRFYCFWGKDPAVLGAHGVYGNPLYCWSA